MKEGAPQKGSAKVQLLADVEGWTVPVAVTANVKLSYSAPSLKLSASGITLGYAAPYSLPVKLTVDPADYLLEEPVIRITDKSRNRIIPPDRIRQTRRESRRTLPLFCVLVECDERKTG